ncbi:MAG TPA: hypothetical protein VFE15_16335 [Marmoricola sp.]|jgi:hypothetical protein|nr:hypothetical protein [Marmoricola sp.]
MPNDVPPPVPGSSAADPSVQAGPPPVPGLPGIAESPAAALAAAAVLTSQCPSCGAQTTYQPGTTRLRCSSCGAERDIAASTSDITEHSFDDWVAKNPGAAIATVGAQTVKCSGCGAVSETTDLAGTCQFCKGALIATDHPAGLVAPEAVVPFGLAQKDAQKAFGAWISSRWFAPKALKKVGSAAGLKGTYIPHWTYDAHTETDYRGERGEHYYVTRTRSVSDGKGGSRTETYQEQETRWHPAAGHVNRDFDDVMVLGSHLLPEKKLHKMGPWTLGDAVPFQPEYLTGYSAVRYDVDPTTGADDAKQQMRSTVEGDCRRDIGGDEQRVATMDVSYSQTMFKLVLLPLWIASYLYQGKTWQVLVNANTGEVIGDRPFSKGKIALAIIAVLVVIAVIVGVVLAAKGGGSS